MSSIIKNTVNGIRYKNWSLDETLAYFAKGVARELKIAPAFWEEIYRKSVLNKRLKEIRNDKKSYTTDSSQWHILNTFENYLQHVKGKNCKWVNFVNDAHNPYYNMKGIRLPENSDRKEIAFFYGSMEDTFFIPVFFDDNHDKSIVEVLDKHMFEGPYGYKDAKMDVTVKKDDVVIDAGSWIGDFSAYAVSKGAIAYAFEPVKSIFDELCKTAEINENIYPLQKGLSDNEGEVDIFISDSASSVIQEVSSTKETIKLTTLDKFVEENKLERIDFIKADIEGAERDMLRGATNVLKKFAPKLAICTYHLPDDPKVLEQIIKDANPDYTVVLLRKKLFAAVIK